MRDVTASKTNGLRQTQESRAAKSGAVEAQVYMVIDAELADVITAWFKLSDPFRSEVLATIRAALKVECPLPE